MTNGDYWDTPGGKAADAADKASSADDYWNSPGVKDAQEDSTKLACGLLFLMYRFANNSFYGARDRMEKTAERAKLQAQARTEGFYWGDGVPDDYLKLRDIAAAAGHSWVLLTSPVFGGMSGGAPTHKPSPFTEHVAIVWYFDEHWEPWCCEWDVDTVKAAIREYGA